MFQSLLTALALGACNYCLVLFIDFCFNEGNVLDWYYSLIVDRVKPRSPKLAKLLATCPVCFGFWVGVACFVLYWKYLGLAPVYFIPFAGVSQFLLLKRFTDE